MSSGAKQGLLVAPETLSGEVREPFDGKRVPFTSFGLQGAVNREQSNTIFDSRLQQGGRITGVDFAGDLTVEARYGNYDDFIALAAFNDWEANKLTFGGLLRKSVSLAYGWSDLGKNIVYGGVHVNTFNLEVAVDAVANLTFGLVALNQKFLDIAPSGDPTSDPLNPVLSAVDVGEILLDGVSTKGVACITSINFNWDNSIEMQKCLGDGIGSGKPIEKTAIGTGSFTIAWSSKSFELFKNQFESAKSIALVVPFTDTAGNKYTLTIPKAEYDGTLPSGGKDDILTADFNYTTIEEAPFLVRTPKA